MGESDRAINGRVRRAGIYVRVSTAKKAKANGDATTDDDDTRSFEQRPEIQIEALTGLAAQRGWTVAKVYQDRASGAKEKRPGLHALMTDARRGQFAVVIVWRFDRFARSVKQLVLALEEFRALTSISCPTKKRSTRAAQWAEPCLQSSPRWPNWNAQ